MHILYFLHPPPQGRTWHFYSLGWFGMFLCFYCDSPPPHLFLLWPINFDFLCIASPRPHSTLWLSLWKWLPWLNLDSSWEESAAHETIKCISCRLISLGFYCSEGQLVWFHSEFQQPVEFPRWCMVFMPFISTGHWTAQSSDSCLRTPYSCIECAIALMSNRSGGNRECGPNRAPDCFWALWGASIDPTSILQPLPPLM